MGLTISLLIFASVNGVLTPISASLGPSAPLDRGYRQMYNLEFRNAHITFVAYANAHPEDPFGPTSDAAAYLFDEFNRMGVLQTALFTDDQKFKERERSSPDPRVRKEFDGAIGQSQKLADAVLQRSPRDRNALFATVLNLGLESDYLSLVQKRDLAALALHQARRTRGAEVAGD